MKTVILTKLSSREVSCLLLTAQGKTVEETAELLKVKTSTVDTWRKNIKRKLICSTMAQAVYVGMRCGCLSEKDSFNDK